MSIDLLGARLQENDVSASSKPFDVFSVGPSVLLGEIGGADLRLSHVTDAKLGADRLVYAEPADGFMLVHHVQPLPGKDVWLDSKHMRVPALPRATLYFMDLRTPQSARMPAQFEVVTFRLLKATLDALAEDLDATRVTSLREPHRWSTHDPVVDHLHAAACAALERREAGPLLASHLLHALATHVAIAYGGMKLRRPRQTGGLAPWQQRRATDLLAANLVKEASLAQLAQECGLSVSHFSRAFKTSTGLSPQAWLQERRVERAKALLRDEDWNLGAIAKNCGFADQSHFTRVFGRIAGATPAHWRRHRLHDD